MGTDKVPMFSDLEKELLLAAVNREIAYRLHYGTRKSEIHPFRRIKKKLEGMETYKEEC